MKILLIGSQHGNERLGDAFYAHLCANYPEVALHTTFLLGNPRAYKQNVRYIESDLNRSYDPVLSTYESRRARVIKRYIDRGNFDLVLDLHTTACKQAPSLLIPSLTPERRAYLKVSFIDKIVIMRHPIVRSSLMYQHPQIIAVEVNHDEVRPHLLDQLACDLQRFLGKKQHFIIRTIYPVDNLLSKDEVTKEEQRQLVNFKPTPAGYIPILTGENSYKKNTHYLGFKVLKEEVTTL